MAIRGKQTPGVAKGATEGGLKAYWPEELQQSAVDVFFLESGLNPSVVNDSLVQQARTGQAPAVVNGITSSAELSIGIAQINVVTCPPEWEWPTLFDPWINVWAAYEIYKVQGWSAWYHSATKLGLI